MATWVDYDTQFVRRRYNKLAPIYIAFEYLFLLPPGIRTEAVKALNLQRGDRVLEVGCGTGRNLGRLVETVGDFGKVYGVDLSEGMLGRAKTLCTRKNWGNVALLHDDAAEYILPEAVDGALFSLSYATMPHRKTALQHAWNQLKPGGRLVIMDARIPDGVIGKLYRPLLTRFLKLTVLGNPDVDILEDLRQLTGEIEVDPWFLNTYFIGRATKP
ncbi:MAG TPA: methyltransferase domain-containing protein [Pyrinomonadaceae bacterium]|nr:methyltransferase domain-containing protein [Pyrinomonadaceae bacterium]